MHRHTHTYMHTYITCMHHIHVHTSVTCTRYMHDIVYVQHKITVHCIRACTCACLHAYTHDGSNNACTHITIAHALHAHKQANTHTHMHDMHYMHGMHDSACMNYLHPCMHCQERIHTCIHANHTRIACVCHTQYITYAHACKQACATCIECTHTRTHHTGDIHARPHQHSSCNNCKNTCQHACTHDITCKHLTTNKHTHTQIHCYIHACMLVTYRQCTRGKHTLQYVTRHSMSNIAHANYMHAYVSYALITSHHSTPRTHVHMHAYACRYQPTCRKQKNTSVTYMHDMHAYIDARTATHTHTDRQA